METQVPVGLDAMFYTLDGRYQGAFERTKTWWQDMATLVPSTSRANHYYWTEVFEGLREWIGERLVKQLKARATVLENKDWELTVGIDRNDLADAQIGMAVTRTEMIGMAARKWPDRVVAAVLLAGETALSYDGQPFFDTDHPVNEDRAGLGVYSNLETSKPLSADNLEFAINSFGGMLAPEGDQYLDLQPTHLIIPPQLRQTARRLLESDLLARVIGEATVADGNPLKGALQLLVVPELAGDSTSWYVADHSKPIKCMIFQQRQAPNFVVKDGPQEDELFWHKRIVMGTDARGNAGFTLPFLIKKFKAS
jgi:phage major head subunit gpT-like protein